MVAAILNLKKCTRGIFGASSEFVWGDVQVSFLKKSAFCNFIPGSCVFFTNALALSWIFITQLDHETVVKPQLRSPRNPVTHSDVPYHPPPPSSSSSSLKDMLCLYQLVLLVLEHEEEDITAFSIHVHPLTYRLQVLRSSEYYGFYMPQIRSDTEVIQK